MIKRFLYLSLLPLALVACKGGSESYEAATDSAASYSAAPSVPMNEASNTADGSEESKKSNKSALPNNRKFVRTAQMSFDVANVELATSRIEKMVGERDGYVTKSELNASQNETKDLVMNSDSIERIASYYIRTAMTIRVPNTQLDSLLAEIASVSTFLHYRIVRADDVTEQYFATSQKAKNFQRAQEKLEAAAEANRNKLRDVTASTSQSLDWANQAVDNEASKMAIDNQVSYSTVELEFSQALMIKKQHLPNSSVDGYEPSFGYEFTKALSTSIYILKHIFLFFIRIWPILAIIAAIVWLTIWWDRRKKKKNL